MARKNDELVLEKGDLSTLNLLVEKFDSRPTIPLYEVHDLYFSHLSLAVFNRKVKSGDIRLVVSRFESSQKAPRFVHLHDLAAYLEGRAREARRIAA